MYLNIYRSCPTATRCAMSESKNAFKSACASTALYSGSPFLLLSGASFLPSLPKMNSINK